MGERRGCSGRKCSSVCFPPRGKEGKAERERVGRERERRRNRQRETGANPRPTSAHCTLCHWTVFLVVFPFYFSIIWVTYAPAKYSLLAFIFYSNPYYLQYIKQSIRAWHLLSFGRRRCQWFAEELQQRKDHGSWNLVAGDFFLGTKFSSPGFFFIHQQNPTSFSFYQPPSPLALWACPQPQPQPEPQLPRREALKRWYAVV